MRSGPGDGGCEEATRTLDTGMRVTIRTAMRGPEPDPGPRDPVAAFQRASFTEYYTRTYGEEGQRFLELCKATVHHQIWAEDATGRIVGAMGLEVSRLSARVTRFTVWPDLLGRGIGSALLEVAEDIARAAGCTKLWAHSKAGLDSRRFYLARGFHQEAVLRNSWAGYDRTIFSKEIGT